MALVRHLMVACLLTAPVAAPQAPAPAPLPGSRLLHTRTIDGPLEVKAATANDEAVLAGLTYVEREFDAPPWDTPQSFVTGYRDALVAAGWRLLDVPRIDAATAPQGTIDLAAHYTLNSNDLYVRLSRSPDGRYRIRVADVGAEDWAAPLAKACRLPVPSLHFELDRPVLRAADAEPALQKLADLLKGRNAPAVEVQGHMDNVGDAGVAPRQALSEARAKAVVSWLVAHGVPASKVTAKGYGKRMPITDNDTDLGRELNRRIEVVCRSAAAR